jgi:hypothetical protein
MSKHTPSDEFDEIDQLVDLLKEARNEVNLALSRLCNPDMGGHNPAKAKEGLKRLKESIMEKLSDYE